MQPPDPAVEAARRAQLYARVGDVRITLGDIEDAINQQSPILRIRYRDPERVQRFAADLVRFELLAAAATTRGFGDDPTVAKNIRQNAVQQLIQTEIDEKVTQDDVPQADIQTYYETHPSEFNRPAMRRASHVVVSDLAAAQALLAEARDADARGFRDIARRSSLDDDTKLRGGDLRYFDEAGRSISTIQAYRATPPPSSDSPAAIEPGEEQPVPTGADPSVDLRLAAAAFALENLGDVSEPIALDDGRYSVLKLTGQRAAETRDFTTAASAIRLRLFRELRQEALDTLVDSLRTRHEPQVFAARIIPIVLNPLGPTERFQGAAHGHGHGDEEAQDGHHHGAQGHSGSTGTPAPTPSPTTGN